MITLYPQTTDVDAGCPLGGGVLNRDLGLAPGAGNVTGSTTSPAVVAIMSFDVNASAFALADATWEHSVNFSLVSANGEFFFQVQAIDGACANLAATGPVAIPGAGVVAGSFSPLAWPEGAVRFRMVVEGRSLDANPASIRVACGASSWVRAAIERKTRLELIADALVARLAAIVGDSAGYNYVIGDTGIAERPPEQIGKFPAAFVAGMLMERDTQLTGALSGKKNEALATYVLALTMAHGSPERQMRLFARDVARALEASPTNLGLSYVLDAMVTDFVPELREPESTKPYSVGFMTVEARYRMGRGVI